MLKGAVFASMAAVAAAGDPWHVDVTNGNFTIKHVTMHTPATNDHWKERAIAMITMSGASDKIVQAGTLQYQVYEHGAPKFIDSGSFAYFHCDNHGCDPSAPLALNLTDPFNPNSDFVITWQFQMPYSDPGADLHDYQVVVWGSDQDHTPYDFSATIDYNVTTDGNLRKPRPHPVVLD